MVLEPGDELMVVLANALPFDVNFDPEGGLLVIPEGGTAGGGAVVASSVSVAPGQTHTYRWLVPPQVSA